jgi:hypothetical protein
VTLEDLQKGHRAKREQMRKVQDPASATGVIDGAPPETVH